MHHKSMQLMRPARRKMFAEMADAFDNGVVS